MGKLEFGFTYTITGASLIRIVTSVSTNPNGNQRRRRIYSSSVHQTNGFLTLLTLSDG